MLGEPAAEGINQREVAVHVLIFDERSTHDDLRNQDERNNVCRRFRIGHDRRDDQPEGDTPHRRHQHHAEIDPEHPPDREDVVPDQDEKEALKERKKTQRDKLGQDVVRQPDVQIAFALEDGAIANDVVGTVR